MEADVARLAAICRERRVRGLVIGLPLNMDGSEGPAARTMRGWARHLAAALALPVYLEDERLTTDAVGEAIADGRLARPKPGAAIDHHAAAVILEDALKAFAAANAAPGGPGLG